jgi:hypothetical protein
MTNCTNFFTKIEAFSFKLKRYDLAFFLPTLYKYLLFWMAKFSIYKKIIYRDPNTGMCYTTKLEYFEAMTDDCFN